MSFLNQRCLINANHYEIGPSNASQGQHTRKDATEQMKNLTLDRTPTKVLGISSADIVPAARFLCRSVFGSRPSSMQCT